MFEIETERLLLRDFISSDIGPYITVTKNEKYQRFYSDEDCSEEKAVFLVNLFIAQSQEVPRSKYQLAIIHKGAKKLIGTCGLRLEDGEQASMGCGVAREFQGSGYAQEAAIALVSYGFRWLGIHRLYAEMIDSNIAAIRLCRQFGMRKEAHFIEHEFVKGQWWDTVIYALLKEEWENVGDLSRP